LSDKLNDHRKAIVQLIRKSPEITIKELARQIGISPTAISNNIAWLKANQYLDRNGSDRKGIWLVSDGNNE